MKSANELRQMIKDNLRQQKKKLWYLEVGMINNYYTIKHIHDSMFFCEAVPI